VPPVAVTMGDPAGVGLDLVIEALRRPTSPTRVPFILIGDPDVLRQRAHQLGRAIEVTRLAPDKWDLTPSGELAVVPVSCRALVVPGHPDPANAEATIAAIELGACLVKSGRVSALVTNPIAKRVLIAAGFPHPGHTDFLGELANRHWGQDYRPVMMLASPELRVVPVTVHIPLSKVPSSLSQGLIIDTARTTAAALTGDFGIARPRIAVCGVNPHAGEGGLIGVEEQTLIAPAIDVLRKEGLSIAGPFSADSLFHADARRRYDAVLAMYHDQALIPLKTLAFDHGVNVTLGLPFVRTSPDHGTAFDIAGSGRASASSFLAALALAEDIARRRAGRAA